MKPYKIEIINNILMVTYQGKVGYETRVKALEDGVELFKSNSTSYNVLIDTRNMINIMTKEEEFKFGSKLAQTKELENSLIALLIQKEKANDQLISIVATTEGYNQKLFVDYDEAINWLK